MPSMAKIPGRILRSLRSAMPRASVRTRSVMAWGGLISTYWNKWSARSESWACSSSHWICVSSLPTSWSVGSNSGQQSFVLHPADGTIKGLYGVLDDVGRMRCRDESCCTHQVNAVQQHTLAQLSNVRGATHEHVGVCLDVAEVKARDAWCIYADKRFENRRATVGASWHTPPGEHVVD